MSENIQTAIERAQKYLESLSRPMLSNDPYLLAISTYALALSNSGEVKHEFKKMLLRIKTIDDGMFTYFKQF